MKILIELKNDERDLWQLCASVFEMKVICLNKKDKIDVYRYYIYRI